MNGARYPASCENIVYLAYRDNFFARSGHSVEQGGRRRRQRKIFPVFGAVISAARTGERARDDSRDGMLTGKYFPRRHTVAVQLFGRHYRFVCGYLENGVLRSVYDQRSALKMFVPVYVDDFGS